jgi:hypothetical protein
MLGRTGFILGEPGEKLVNVRRLIALLAFQWIGTPGEISRAVINEPVPQCSGRSHVVLVVPGYGVKVTLAPINHPFLIGDDRASTLVDVVLAFEIGESFKVLESVSLYTYLDCVACNEKKIHKHAGIDQPLECSLRDGIPVSQPLEC